MPAPTTNSPTIITTTGLAKPESASAGVSMPNISKASRAQSATISDLTLPLMKKTHETISIASVITEGDSKDTIKLPYALIESAR